jgi:hypothetical protein
MPWLLLPGTLRQLRRARQLDRRAAARMTGLAIATVRRHEESALATRGLQDETVRRYAAAYGCAPEAFARWIDHGQVPSARAAAADDDALTDEAAPPRSTLALRAACERALGEPQVVGDGVPLVGPAFLEKVNTACALFRDQRVAIAGRVEDHGYAPEAAARAIDAEVGVGARFRLSRSVVRGVPVFATVFTRRLEHTRYLLERAEDRRRATVLTRVFVKTPGDGWKGFFVFEKRPKPRPFAFVVEDILDLDEDGRPGDARPPLGAA